MGKQYQVFISHTFFGQNGDCAGQPTKENTNDCRYGHLWAET